MPIRHKTQTRSTHKTSVINAHIVAQLRVDYNCDVNSSHTKPRRRLRLTLMVFSPAQDARETVMLVARSCHDRLLEQSRSFKRFQPHCYNCLVNGCCTSHRLYKKAKLPTYKAIAETTTSGGNKQIANSCKAYLQTRRVIATEVAAKDLMTCMMVFPMFSAVVHSTFDCLIARA